MPLKQDSIYGGMETIARDFDARILAGANDYVLLHATGGDVDAPADFENCRAISVDTEGIIKVRYKNDEKTVRDEVLFINSGQVYPIRNVIRLFRFTTGAVEGTAISFASDGTSKTNAVKLRR